MGPSERRGSPNPLGSTMHNVPETLAIPHKIAQ